MEYKNFTSLPPEQEATFVIYEQTSSESAKKAMTMGTITGVAIGILGLILFLSFDAPKNAHAVEPESDLKEEPRKKAAPAPAPAPTPAPAEVAPAAEAAPTGEAPAAAPTEAPEPPKGATKAPPTDLIK